MMSFLSLSRSDVSSKSVSDSRVGSWITFGGITDGSCFGISTSGCRGVYFASTGLGMSGFGVSITGLYSVL